MLLRLSRGQGTGLRVRHSGGRHSKVVDVVADQNTLRADQFFARVGGDTITAVKAYGLSIPDGYGLTMTGNLFAATPELDSLMLFGTGGLGLAGYALMRHRARRK